MNDVFFSLIFAVFLFLFFVFTFSWQIEINYTDVYINTCIYCIRLHVFMDVHIYMYTYHNYEAISRAFCGHSNLCALRIALHWIVSYIILYACSFT